MYNAAGVPRIDNFLIRLIRDYIAKASKDRSNSLIFGPYFQNKEYLIKACFNGFVPTEAFTMLDAMGLITDQNNVPIFYHLHRHRRNKIIDLNNIENIPKKYSQVIPDIDLKNKYAKNTGKYWWLDT